MALPEMRELLFKRPEFPGQMFVTVRRGTKWATDPPETETSSGKLVILRETDGDEIGAAVIEARYIGPVHLIPVAWLSLEHDVTCRNHSGLLVELQRVYDDPGISGDTIVTALLLSILTMGGKPWNLVRTAVPGGN